LFVKPFVEVTGRATAGHHGETFFEQALANGGSDAPHAAGDVGYFFTHIGSFVFLQK